jgi:hypothetical protein
VYEKAEIKSRQTLLRYQAIKIADYDALYHFHYWTPDPEPKYICYVGQSKHFEKWYNNIKSDQSRIYKDFEEKSTFKKYVFKESDYDIFSIWKYNQVEAIEMKIQEAEKKKKYYDTYIEDLYKELGSNSAIR